MRALYKNALKKGRGLPKDLPTSDVDWHKEPPRKTAVARADLRAWNEARLKIQNPIVQEIPLFILLTGLRRADALSVKWDDVKRDRRVIERLKPKGGAPFDLPMSTQIEACLDRVRLAAAVRYPQSEWVFPGNGKDGHVVVLKNIRGMLTPHDWRRTFKSMGISAGVPKSVMRQLMNHADGDVADKYEVDAAMMDFLISMQQRVSDYIEKAMG